MHHDASLCLLCALNFVSCSFLSSPFEDNEGHKADHDSCQDGAVDWDELVIQTLVEPLLGITISGGGGAVCRTL